MTTEERNVVAYHLDQLETLVGAAADVDAMMHVAVVLRRIDETFLSLLTAMERARLYPAGAGYPDARQAVLGFVSALALRVETAEASLARLARVRAALD